MAMSARTEMERLALQLGLLSNDWASLLWDARKLFAPGSKQRTQVIRWSRYARSRADWCFVESQRLRNKGTLE